MPMPIIPVPLYADVPLSAGIPPMVRDPLWFNQSQDRRAQVDEANMPKPVQQTWGLFDADGKLALEPDTILAIDYRDSAMIAKYPLEKGAFASYNKVEMPYDVRVVMAKGGSEKDRRDFWEALQALRGTLDTYSIVMPDLTILDLNIVHRDLSRQQRQGANMLEVEIGFQQVRITGQAQYSKTKEGDGADRQAVGAVDPRAPTTAEQQAGAASKDSAVKASAAN